jgi:hypothetical protein
MVDKKTGYRCWYSSRMIMVYLSLLEHLINKRWLMTSVLVTSRIPLLPVNHARIPGVLAQNFSALHITASNALLVTLAEAREFTLDGSSLLAPVGMSTFKSPTKRRWSPSIFEMAFCGSGVAGVAQVERRHHHPRSLGRCTVELRELVQIYCIAGGLERGAFHDAQVEL